jgi:hypothetical protein
VPRLFEALANHLCTVFDSYYMASIFFFMQFSKGAMTFEVNSYCENTYDNMPDDLRVKQNMLKLVSVGCSEESDLS